jgi:lysophospholipase L1-like esterase
MSTDSSARCSKFHSVQTQAIEALEPRQLLAATRIMPLGDSITSSFGGHDSYRYWLWNSLQDAGYKNIDFVGSQHGVFGGTPSDPNFDQDHEGHSGWTADQIAAQVEDWARQARPDVVLLHIGTNDMRASQSVASTINDISTIIDRLRRVNPNVTVLLAKLIPDSENVSSIAALDDAIPNLAAQKNRSSSRVVLVDQSSGFDVSRDTFDGLHPNESGEKKIASKFFAAVKPFLSQAAPTPQHVPLTGTTFMGELTPTSMTNGYGPVEINQSVGEGSARDGERMSIDGRQYSRGLGTHAGSRIDYRLDGKQKWFAADLGIDDETGGRGSVVYKVYVDGKRIFSSNIIHGGDPIQSIKLRISGARRITLIVSDAGDGNSDDHANWANARVISYNPDQFV